MLARRRTIRSDRLRDSRLTPALAASFETLVDHFEFKRKVKRKRTGRMVHGPILCTLTYHLPTEKCYILGGFDRIPQKQELPA